MTDADPVAPPPRLGWWRSVPAVAALLAYANALGADFVLDDYHFLVENPVVKGTAPIPLLGVVTTNGGPFYRPLALATHRLDYALGGPSPGWMHLSSVLWHLLACMLLVECARWILPAAFARAGAVWAGVLFAVHPVHVEAVTALANRSEILQACAAISAVLARRALPEIPSRIAVFFSAALALACKESGIIVPVLVLLADVSRPDRRMRWGGVVAASVPLLLYVPLRLHVFRGTGLIAPTEHYAGLGLVARLASSSDLYRRMMVLLCWPARLSPDWGPPAVPDLVGPTPGAALGLLLLVGTVVAAWASLRRAPWAAFGLAWWIAGCGMYLHVGIPMALVLAERLLYTPSVGVALAAGGGLAWLASRLPRAWPVHVAATLAVMALLGRTVARNADWRDPVSLWSAAVEYPDATAFSWANMGASWVTAGHPERAIDPLRRAVAMSPCNPAFRVYLARLAADGGQPALGVRILEEAEQLGCSDADIRAALASIRARVR